MIHRLWKINYRLSVSNTFAFPVRAIFNFDVPYNVSTMQVYLFFCCPMVLQLVEIGHQRSITTLFCFVLFGNSIFCFWLAVEYMKVGSDLGLGDGITFGTSVSSTTYN